MPFTRIYFYRTEEGGSIPFLEWFGKLQKKAQLKCQRQLILLQDLGHQVRRPHGDYLRDGIYELRVRVGRVNYRLLYFFFESNAAVVSHGLVKERLVPPAEIDRAIKRKKQTEDNPNRHLFEPRDE